MYCLGPALLMANALPCSLNKVFDNAMNAKMIGSTLTSFVVEVSEASKQDIQDCFSMRNCMLTGEGLQGLGRGCQTINMLCLALVFRLRLTSLSSHY